MQHSTQISTSSASRKTALTLAAVMMLMLAQTQTVAAQV
jgi:hypothetical protein